MEESVYYKLSKKREELRKSIKNDTLTLQVIDKQLNKIASLLPHSTEGGGNYKGTLSESVGNYYRERDKAIVKIAEYFKLDKLLSWLNNKIK